VIAFHEVSGRDIAEIQSAGVGGRSGVGVERVGGDQMSDGTQFVAVGAPGYSKGAVAGRIERRAVAGTPR
jgi:hypothetical protein